MKSKIKSIFIILITVLPPILIFFSWIPNLGVTQKVLTNIASVLSVFSIAVGNNYSKMQEKMIFSKAIREKYSDYENEEMRNLIVEYAENSKDNVLPPKEIKNNTNVSRNHQRQIMLYGIFVLIMVEFIVAYRMKWGYIFVAVICLESMAYMYLDYFGHVKRYAQKYDDKVLKQKGLVEKPNTMRGLARIYLDEYKRTKLDISHSFYREKKTYCTECKRQIIRMAVDKSNNYMQVFGYILMFINIMFLMPETETFLIQIFDVFNFKMNSRTAYLGLYFIVICIAMILNLYSLPNFKRINKKQNLAFLTYLEKDRDFANTYEKYKKNLTELVKCRGIFQHTIAELDKPDIFIEDIPIDNRMLFIHRAETHISRLQITITLSYVTFVMLLRHILGVSRLFLLITIVLAVLFIGFYWVLKLYYLPVAGKKKVIEQCRLLIEEEYRNMRKDVGNIREEIEGIVETYDDNPVITYMADDGICINFSAPKVLEIMKETKAILKKCGINDRSHIAIIASESFYKIIAGLALAYSDMTAVIIDADLPADKICKMLESSNVNALFTTADIYRKIPDTYIKKMWCFEMGKNYTINTLF